VGGLEAGSRIAKSHCNARCLLHAVRAWNLLMRPVSASNLCIPCPIPTPAPVVGPWARLPQAAEYFWVWELFVCPGPLWHAAMTVNGKCRYLPPPCRPKGGVLQSFTACTSAHYSENIHIKSFVHPPHVVRASWNPHSFEFKDGFYAG
jgi:hypothetical protein